jgi:sugar transferase EpsL
MNKYGKRFVDICVSLVLLVLLAPLILVVAMLSLLFLGRPVYYTQARPGYQEKIFKLIKFRTMSNAVDHKGELLSDAQRLTPYGKFLRKYSLDELPTLLNVLKGEMSLVGPRPLLPEYLPFYTEFQKQRHTVKPGITGWAQINGRNSVDWPEKFALDVWYVHNQSLALDFKILIKTVTKVIKADGVSHDKHVTMPRFDKLKN